jgi:hypothetical protein
LSDNTHDLIEGMEARITKQEVEARVKDKNFNIRLNSGDKVLIEKDLREHGLVQCLINHRQQLISVYVPRDALSSNERSPSKNQRLLKEPNVFMPRNSISIKEMAVVQTNSSND